MSAVEWLRLGSLVVLVLSSCVTLVCSVRAFRLMQRSRKRWEDTERAADELETVARRMTALAASAERELREVQAPRVH